MTSALCYTFEALYYIIKRHTLRGKDNALIYFVISLVIQVLVAWFGVYTHGFLADEMTQYYWYGLGILVAIDIIILDTLIVCYAFCAK
jgi:hypothetical protein